MSDTKQPEPRWPPPPQQPEIVPPQPEEPPPPPGVIEALPPAVDAVEPLPPAVDAVEPQPPAVVQLDQHPAASIGEASEGESIAPALRGIDPEPPPVTQASLLPIQQHRVGGQPRHRVHIEGTAGGGNTVVRVGRDQGAPDVARITLPLEVVESLVIALVENDCQRALEVLSPHYNAPPTAATE